ncbi:ethanolamine ammonia-lyase subunit EutC [Lichenifustis flavocetrariae]|uniref:Ethanolamine ammonia-lyase small subunit n=1 Tax=Lichenifustis flavocetrariae TaxID=2949735 RepID=A0AA41YXP9_9HYPH|nr:ethanolamine ammonia-lyase subunit EutC [Lichenifustis flavocetrariae]MCW6510484.1 ethanolamine ammonia-lyase subunit EutC [Lichenifustis flavocetrariae]
MNDDTPPVPRIDPWTMLRELTPARVALGRTGASLPTHEILRFGHAHSLARDAVHATLDVQALRRDLAVLDCDLTEVRSAAEGRTAYLRRPDLGRRLSDESRISLDAKRASGSDLVIVVADGLSATAVHANAAALLDLLVPAIRRKGWSLGPIVVATQARVALGDEVGAALDARMVLVLIGERPGLSSPDSLGAYLTFGPKPGRRDNERNCVSNIRGGGLVPPRAARAILWLIEEAFRRGETGVALKDESVDIAIEGASPHLPSLP